MLYNELTISFPWYEKIEQQDRYNENVEPICDYKLISPVDTLLPFEFLKPTTSNLPVNWEIYEINTMESVADISSEIPKLFLKQVNGKDYIFFTGGKIPGLRLQPGYYYSRMVFPDNYLQFSEMFYVPPNFFNVDDDDDIPYMKIVWYNLTDLSPIFYNQFGLNGAPRFKNICYLDSFITASEPEIEEDGERDGNNKLIVTFQKLTIQYRITVIVPDFLKKALMAMQLHDTVILTTKNGVRSGKLDHLTVSSEPEANGGLSLVDILFTEDLALVKKGCGQNMQ